LPSPQIFKQQTRGQAREKFPLGQKSSSIQHHHPLRSPSRRAATEHMVIKKGAGSHAGTSNPSTLARLMFCGTGYK